MSQWSLESVGQKLDNLCMNFDAHKKEMKEEFTEVKSRQDKTNGRIGKLERWKAYIAGAVSVLTILVLPVVFLIIKSALDVWGK